MAVSFIVGQLTGNQPTEEQMIALAQNTPSGVNPGPIYAPSTTRATQALMVAYPSRIWWCCSTTSASSRR